MHVTAAVLRSGVSYARQTESSTCLVSAVEACRPVRPSNGASVLLLWSEAPSAAPRLHRGVPVSDEAMDTIFFPDLELRGPHWMRLAGDCPSFIGISVICYDATDLHQSQLSENLGEGSS